MCSQVKRNWQIAGFIFLVILASCKKNDYPKKEEDTLSNKVILDWNLLALKAEGGPSYQHPLLFSRVNAMMHIAMHDALNAIMPLYQPYAYKPAQHVIADPVAAAASAAYTVLIAHFPKDRSLESALAASLSGITNGPLKEKGLVLGGEAGRAILALRNGDGALADPIAFIPVTTVPGQYNIVPPYVFIYAPFWASMKPFSLEHPEQFRSSPPPSLTNPVYTKDFNEVKTLGSLNSNIRSEEQGAYAKYWYELAEITWNRIARVTAEKQHTPLFATARSFALLDMALADSYIAGWDAKYHYNFWRPYTAIRAANTDGNEHTIADEAWEPAELTPPVQDYPSTHSVLGNAGATILSALYGHHVSFTITTSTAVPAGAVRTFSSFREGANQNADSRVMAGIHFRFSTEAGQKMGEEVAKFTLRNYLKPLY